MRLTRTDATTLKRCSSEPHHTDATSASSLSANSNSGILCFYPKQKPRERHLHALLFQRLYAFCRNAIIYRTYKLKTNGEEHSRNAKGSKLCTLPFYINAGP